MGAGSQGENPAPKKPAHINTLWVGTFFCGNCKTQVGTPEEFSINDAGDRFAVEAETMDCPVCQTSISHKRIVLTEPV